jgi:hypothetical protein
MGLVLQSPLERIEQMIVLTKPQRESLFNLFRRDFPSWVPFRQNGITRKIE